MKLAALLPPFSAVSLLAADAETIWLAPFKFATDFAALGPWVTVPIVLLVVFALPFLLGWILARSVNMPNYSWRIGIILCSIVASIVTIGLGWPPKLGVDLKGGWIMIYQIDDSSAQASPVNVTRRQLSDDTSNRGALIQKLKQRLNPDGLKEISIRPYGLNEVEIIVPETDRAEVDKLKRQIQEQGVMEFLILAERGQPTDATLFDAARAQAEDPALRRKRSIFNAKKEEIGRWVRVGREDKEDPQLSGVRPLRVVGSWGSYLIRDPATGKIIDSGNIPGGRLKGTKYIRDVLKLDNVEILTKLHERYKVTGADLRDGGVYSSIDESGRPEVAFSFKPASAANMGGLTQANIERQLAIVLDDTLLSHATIRSQISDNGRITGNFSQEEVNFIIRILKAGSLPAKLYPEPVYEDPSDPTLGAENIRQGAYAIVISLALVFLFCLVYYRFAGVVACIALFMNILLTVGALILFGATLTMPGLAGMVLTVGMAVDSNVLIFERMREELTKGASLRMAIRNGYDRAMVTIIDSNLTTLLTAVILYIIGTDQLVGFAVTLTLGLVISMFTAVFCTRVIFEVAERTGAVRTMKFLQFLTATNYDFVRYMGICVAASCILIGIGLAAAFYRGGGIFDIDLRGGTSIQVALVKPLTDPEMRAMLDKAFEGVEYEGSKVDYTLKPVGRAVEGNKHTTFRVDSIDPDVKKIQDHLIDHLKEGDKSLLRHFLVEFEPIKTAMLPRDESIYFTALQAEEGKDAAVADEVKKSDPEATPAAAKEATDADAEKKPETASTKDAGSDADERATTKAETTAPEADEPKVTTVVRFKDSAGEPELIDRDGVVARVEAAGKELGFEAVGISVDHPDWDKDPITKRAEWNVSLSASPDEANRILAKMASDAKSEPVWPASKKIGGQIAGDFVKIAIGALLASVLGIILYIWFRFQNVTWGFAAVVALIHDVLFMLAGIAVSYWFAGAPAFTGLQEFKIDLTVIAAFLTLIGYSINDTIVIFDRMREIKGKLPTINRQIVNDSVNQTLSRSVLTFLTVFMTVAVLYAWGGPGIHPFAYAMLIGTVVGMYSTVFIAAPFLLWMLNRNTPAKKPV